MVVKSMLDDLESMALMNVAEYCVSDGTDGDVCDFDDLDAVHNSVQEQRMALANHLGALDDTLASLENASSFIYPLHPLLPGGVRSSAPTSSSGRRQHLQVTSGIAQDCEFLPLLSEQDLIRMRAMGDYCSVSSTQHCLIEYQEMMLHTLLTQRSIIAARIRSMDRTLTSISASLQHQFESRGVVSLIRLLEEEGA